MDWFFTWWAWAIFALALAILEMLAPAFVLLGFAIGAGVVALAMAVIGPGLLGGSVTWILAVFAILSFLSWVGLRHYFKPPSGQVKNFEHDIND